MGHKRVIKDCGGNWLVNFNTGKARFVSFYRSDNSGLINVKIHWSGHKEKCVEVLGLIFTSKSDHDNNVASITKTASKKREILIRFIKIISLEDAEAATRGVLFKEVFLEMSQNSQENTCTRVSFLIKLQALGLQLC